MKSCGVFLGVSLDVFLGFFLGASIVGACIGVSGCDCSESFVSVDAGAPGIVDAAMDGATLDITAQGDVLSVDGAIADSADGATWDGAVADSSLRDQVVVDADSVGDVPTSDTAFPDTAVADIPVPDGQVSDAQVSDVQVADVSTADVTSADLVGCGDTQTDPANCGYCGHSCAVNEVCNLGNCGPVCGGYTVTEFASSDDSYIYPTAINNLGEVVGEVTVGSIKYAFLYRNGSRILLDELGGGWSEALDIDDASQIVGFSRTTNLESLIHACRWDGQQQLVDLGVSAEYLSKAFATNNSGDIVGRYDSTADSEIYGGFLIHQGAYSELPLLSVDINDLGVIAGSVKGTDSVWRAATYHNGALTILPTLDEAVSSKANAINASGQVAGYANFRDEDHGLAEHAAFFSAGSVIDLGTMGRSRSRAFGLNDHGDVVGFAGDHDGSPSHAFLYTSASATNLHNLVAAECSWDSIEVASSINNAGQIVGLGKREGNWRGFLLTPYP